jgi:hypothetical protein
VQLSVRAVRCVQLSAVQFEFSGPRQDERTRGIGRREKPREASPAVNHPRKRMPWPPLLPIWLRALLRRPADSCAIRQTW